MRIIGLLGGTFNPIHLGHLRMAQALADALQLDEVRFIPSATPPHKVAPEVSAIQRAEMVRIAISDNPLFKLDMRELERTGASYTIDTLISLRKELGASVALCLIMGSDAFIQLNTWARWQELLNYCHIILVQRPNTIKQSKLADELAALLEQNYTESIADLSQKPAGYVHMQAISALDISSTVIRANLKTTHSIRYLVTNDVLNYINLNSLYG
ncbi:MAG: nicotinate-nucleotide adenylyltransferase [Bdellovibrio sp.]|nr:nicotinate-nucleotide adenylyltransferase [Methylotenera sp.]